MIILVVDDEVPVELLFRQRFRREVKAGAFDFAFATSGEEALEVLTERGAEIALVLTDHKMPGMSGIDLIEHVRSMPAPVPVCLMSAYSDEAHKQEALRHGADAYFTKPLDFGLISARFNALAADASTSQPEEREVADRSSGKVTQSPPSA